MARSNHNLKVVPDRSANLQEFATRLDSLPDNYLACREMQHAWVITQDYTRVDTRRDDSHRPRRGNTDYIERQLTCDSCGMVRIDTFLLATVYGRTVLRKIQSAYVQPDGYAIRGVGSPMGAGEFVRGMAYDRLLRQSENQ